MVIIKDAALSVLVVVESHGRQLVCDWLLYAVNVTVEVGHLLVNQYGALNHLLILL